MNWIKSYFEFDKLNTNFKNEIVGGTTTFLAMCYILIVNPMTLADAGMDKGAVFVATALVTALGCFLMGMYAKFPIAVAPGMGLNAFFAYTVVLSMGMSWETALAAVFVSSTIFIILSLSGVREKIINAIPVDLKHATGVGIGLFIAFIGLKNAGIIVADEATFVALGDLSNPQVLLAVFGLIVTVIMVVRNISGAIFYGMIITTIVGIFFGLIAMPEQIMGPIPSLAPTLGAAIEPLTSGVLLTKEFWIVVFTMLFVSFFDCAGTIVAVSNQCGLVKDNKLPRAEKALLADSIAGAAGALLGTSNTSAYIESSAGVAAGARSGFAAVVTGCLFLLALFFAPLLSIVTSAVTAPALIIVGVLMAQNLGEINWKRIEIAIPAFITIICMPLTFGIATGIALGFLFYPITMVACGRKKEVSPTMYILAVIFILFFIMTA